MIELLRRLPARLGRDSKGQDPRGIRAHCGSRRSGPDHNGESALHRDCEPLLEHHPGPHQHWRIGILGQPWSAHTRRRLALARARLRARHRLADPVHLPLPVRRSCPALSGFRHRLAYPDRGENPQRAVSATFGSLFLLETGRALDGVGMGRGCGDGLLHRAAGLGAVAWLYGLAIAASVWLWIRLTWRTGGDFLLAAAMLPLLWTTGGLHWLARPHVFGWLWLLAVLIAAERGETRFRPVHTVMAVGSGALWANMHASFVLGFAVLALYAFGEGMKMAALEQRGWQRARWCALAAVCLLAGTLANPYGMALHRHVFSYLTDTELLSRVAEFPELQLSRGRRFDRRPHPGGRRHRRRMRLLAAQSGSRHVLLFFSILALRSARGLPLAAVAALPLANGSITLALLRLNGLRPVLQRVLNAVLSYSGNLRRIDTGHHGLFWLPPLAALAALLLSVPAVNAKAGFPPDEFPVTAAEHVASLPPGARILAPDKFGGYLIYRFRGERKVFIDGRSELLRRCFHETIHPP